MRRENCEPRAVEVLRRPGGSVTVTVVCGIRSKRLLGRGLWYVSPEFKTILSANRHVGRRLGRADTVLSAAAFVVQSGGAVVVHTLIGNHVGMLYIVYSLDSGNCG